MANQGGVRNETPRVSDQRRVGRRGCDDRSVWAQAPKGAKQSTLDRIAIMTLNFQNILKVPDVEDNPNRTLELFDIAEMIADQYGVHKVEFQHYHIPSTEPSYLKELRSHIEKSKSRMTQINLEFSGLNMSAPRVARSGDGDRPHENVDRSRGACSARSE